MWCWWLSYQAFPIVIVAASLRYFFGAFNEQTRTISVSAEAARAAAGWFAVGDIFQAVAAGLAAWIVWRISVAEGERQLVFVPARPDIDQRP
jgi:hypothetical protein